MALVDWQDEMNTMLIAFNHQAMHSLKNIKISFKQHGLTFNPEFRKYFLEASNKRIEESFDQFQMDLKMENQLNSSLSAVASQSPLMTSKPIANQRSSVQSLIMNDSVEATHSNNEINVEINNPNLISNNNTQSSIRSINISDSDDEQEVLVKVDTENIANNHQNGVSTATGARTINRPHKTALDGKVDASDPKTLPLEIEDGYKCQFCEYENKFRINVVCHIRIHTGEKPFRCKFCFIKFRHHMSLHFHLKKHHKNKSGLK